MRTKIRFYFIFLIICSCKSADLKITVAIERIDVNGIFFSYIYDNMSFKGVFPLDICEKGFYSTDSLIIIINKRNPEQYSFAGVKRRAWQPQEAVISTNSERPETTIYGYHQVETKPLFQGANNEFENDSLIVAYLKGRKKISSKAKLIGVSVFINGVGQVSFNKVYSDNANEIEQIKEMIDILPDFSPPYHKGDTVTVRYLIEIPLPTITDNR